LATNLRPGSFLEIDIGELLAVVIADHEAGVQLLRQIRAARSGAATFIIACSWSPLVELT
jgi:hypothetical protein